MKLNEVIQSKEELQLSKLDRPLVFNNLTLADQAWLMDNYKDDEMQRVIAEFNIREILKIACRFLDDKSKEFLSKVEVVEVNEFGERLEKAKFTLSEKLYRICSEADLIEIINKILAIRTKSTEQLMKTAEKFQKKTEVSIPTTEM